MIIKKTRSLCPQCLKPLEADIYEDQGRVMIKKECPEHGSFNNVYWSDSDIYKKAEEFNYSGKGLNNTQTEIDKSCPLDCGICPEHESHTILGLIDVTNRCNLKCPVCFANAAVSNYLYEPSFEEIRAMLRNLRSIKPISTPAIQYAGGEPTIRKDIVDLIKLAKEEGFTHTQIASNGVRLAKRPDLVKQLKEAELNTVYLQFDGVSENPYVHNRGKNLLPLKLEAIENCRKFGLAIVLVPTIVKGVNHDQIGDIIRFAAENVDIIRGVNFQPVSFAGRTPADQVEAQRVTIPDFQKMVEEQTDHKIQMDDFYPASSVHSLSEFIQVLEDEPQVTFTCHHHCGTATYIFIDNGDIIPITRFVDVDRFFDLLEKSAYDIKEGGFTGKAKSVARATLELPRTIDTNETPKSIDIKNILASVFKDRSYKSLGDFHYKTLLISCMHFMDPWNFDTDRVKRCVIHYALPDGRIVPFCTMNSLYREEVEKNFSVPLNKKIKH